MDSPTGFDHDDFFGSYDAEQANAGMSLTPHEFDDAADRPPSEEQLAHWGRFRKPVGAVIAAMALLSLVGLGIGSAHHEVSVRPLVAHYGSAIAATPSTVSGQSAMHETPSAGLGDSSDILPQELSTFVARVWSSFEPPEPSVVGATVPLLVTNESDPELEHASQDAGPSPFVEQTDTNHAARFVPPPPTSICLLPRAASGPAALDSGHVHGQAHEAWSLPPSMTSSIPFVRH